MEMYLEYWDSLIKPGDFVRKLLFILSLLISVSSAIGKEAQSYLMRLTSEDRSAVEDKLEEIRRKKDGLVQLSEGAGNIFLIIHGIDFPSFPEEWVIPFGELILKRQHSYLHKWSNRTGLEENRELFLASITEILKKFQIRTSPSSASQLADQFH